VEGDCTIVWWRKEGGEWAKHACRLPSRYRHQNGPEVEPHELDMACHDMNYKCEEAKSQVVLVR
jgi:hypothetical protein